MSTQQPEALRLADELDGTVKTGYWEAAAELRRLHSVNAELVEFAQSYIEWIEPLIKDIGMQEMERKARAAIAKATGEHHEHG
jgi:hypothetical protein